MSLNNDSIACSVFKYFFHSKHIEGMIPSQLGMLPSIEKLELQSNYLYGEVPKELGHSPLSEYFN